LNCLDQVKKTYKLTDNEVLKVQNLMASFHNDRVSLVNAVCVCYCARMCVVRVCVLFVPTFSRTILSFPYTKNTQNSREHSVGISFGSYESALAVSCKFFFAIVLVGKPSWHLNTTKLQYNKK
jgi:hypothetical protein